MENANNQLTTGQENSTGKKKMPKWAIRLVVALAVSLVAVLVIVCLRGITKDKGYSLMEEDIKSHLYVPSSYKCESVYVKSDYRDDADAQYKISYTCKNGLDITIHTIVYYGYNSKNGRIVAYGADSTRYDSAIGKAHKL